MTVKRSRPIVVRRAPGDPSQARVQLAHGVVRAALGRGGVRTLKREGDGGTPRGRFPIRLVLYRHDRLPRPRTRALLRAIRKFDGWCDDLRDANYNKLVQLPGERSAESLARADGLYDLVAVLGYNDRMRVRGRGSAIFLHLARSGFTPTEGCVGFDRRDLLRLLAELRRGTDILIVA